MGMGVLPDRQVGESKRETVHWNGPVVLSDATIILMVSVMRESKSVRVSRASNSTYDFHADPVRRLRGGLPCPTLPQPDPSPVTHKGIK